MSIMKYNVNILTKIQMEIVKKNKP